MLRLAMLRPVTLRPAMPRLAMPRPTPRSRCQGWRCQGWRCQGRRKVAKAGDAKVATPRRTRPMPATGRPLARSRARSGGRWRRRGDGCRYCRRHLGARDRGLTCSKRTLEHLVRGIVDFPDEVRVSSRNLRRGRVLQVRVHPDDLGKVIGRGGRTARALRTVLGSLAGDSYVRVDLLEPTSR